jgi:hypothetical protein
MLKVSIDYERRILVLLLVSRVFSLSEVYDARIRPLSRLKKNSANRDVSNGVFLTAGNGGPETFAVK